MKLPRFRLRTLLILVLLAGVVVWGFTRWWPRYRECRSSADYYSRMEAIHRQAAAKFRELLPGTQTRVSEVKRKREEFAVSVDARGLAAWEALEAGVRDVESVLRARIAKAD